MTVCTLPIRSTEVTVDDLEEACSHLAHARLLPDDERHERINVLLTVRDHMLGRCTCDGCA